MNDRIDDLLRLIEAEPEGLRTAEFLQAESVLQALVGKTITGVHVEETRVAISTADGARHYFYGFLGSERPA